MAKFESKASKKLQEQVEFAKQVITQESQGAEGFLITCHFVKKGMLNHNRTYYNFPAGDWGSVMIQIANEAKIAKSLSSSVTENGSQV